MTGGKYSSDMAPGRLEPLGSFLAAVRRWAESQQDIVGILLVGSWARGEARPGSDVDLVVLSADPEALLADWTWIDHMGRVRTVAEEDWGRVRSLRVHHTSGLEVEYGVTGGDWLAEPLDAGTKAVLQAGARIIYQRGDELSSSLEALLSPAPEELSQPFGVDAGPQEPGGGGGSPGPNGRGGSLERSMVLIGAGLCLIVTLGVLASVAPGQPIWPLPGGYFIEILVLTLGSAVLWTMRHRFSEAATWVTVGIVSGFSWMARLSVGVLYAPIALVFGVAAITHAVRTRARLATRLGLVLLAGMGEVGVILLLSRLSGG